VWCHQQCVAVRAWGCLRWIPTQKDAKTQFFAPWHPAVAATNNLMTDLYSSNEMSGLWPGLVPKKTLKTWPPHLLNNALRSRIAFEQKERDYLLWGSFRSSSASSSTPAGCLLQLIHGLDEGARGAKSYRKKKQ
jgi:hypothetical protein